jgi:hypothetical protein
MKMRNGWSWMKQMLLMSPIGLFHFGSSESVAWPQTTFSGQATVVDATLLGLDPILISDAGPLPPEGGAEHEHLLVVSVPGLLNAEIAHAATVGQGKAARSEASVANLSLTFGGHAISAGFLMARATAQCRGQTASVSGDSQIAELVVNGQAISVGTSPNQEIGLVDALGIQVGRIVINEQESSVDGAAGDIVVTALHVEVFGVADVAIARAHADVRCDGEGPARDFVTGGGWITGTPSGLPANFGVAGGIRNGEFWGHLNYIDHGAGTHVKATSITAYVVVLDAEGMPTTTRRIEGTAEVNGQGVFAFQVDVSDNGEPGTNDTFALRLSNGYTSFGDLNGGNIQLHTGER